MTSYPVKVVKEGSAFWLEFPDVPIAHTFGVVRKNACAMHSMLWRLLSSR